MELLRLKKRLQLTHRGHDLLKDKLDELVREFIKMIRKEESLREEVEASFLQILESYTSTVFSLRERTRAIALSPVGRWALNFSTQRIMNVTYPWVEVEERKTALPYGNQLPLDMDRVYRALENLFPKILELAVLEKSIILLGEEIRKTRRKVNALEYVLIPELEEAVKFITFKLSELERSSIIRLMKIKERLEGEGR